MTGLVLLALVVALLVGGAVVERRRSVTLEELVAAFEDAGRAAEELARSFGEAIDAWPDPVDVIEATSSFRRQRG